MAMGVALIGGAASQVSAQFLSELDETVVTIPDNDPAGVSTIIEVDDSAIISGMQVMLRIDHADTGQLHVELKHIDTGTKITLLSIIGAASSPDGAENDRLWINLSDDALTSIENAADSDFLPPASIQGSFSPNEALSAFDGENSVGSWELTVRDLELGGAGTLAAWSINFNSAFTDMGLGLPGSSSTSRLWGGWDLTPGQVFVISVEGAKESVVGILFVGVEMLPYATPFKNGVFGPVPSLEVPLATDSNGNYFPSPTTVSTWPSGVPAGSTMYLQFWYPDVDLPKKVAATNTIAAVTP
jgi:hypothetical protein